MANANVLFDSRQSVKFVLHFLLHHRTALETDRLFLDLDTLVQYRFQCSRLLSYRLSLRLT